MPNSNLDRRLAEERLRAMGFELDGALNALHLVIHHSQAKDGKTYDWPAIRTYHMSYRKDGNIITQAQYEEYVRRQISSGLEKPWSDIGYHAGVELVDGQYRWNIGRSLKKIGAHANGFNQQSFGVCFIGNYDQAAPPMALWDFAAPTILDLMRWFVIPIKEVIGHREVYERLGQVQAKTCPGSKWSMQEFRADLNRRLLEAVS